MTTKIYGAWDDLVEFEGDVSGEFGACGTDDRTHGVLVVCSDGTLLDVKYGKDQRAIWGVRVMRGGDYFDHLDPCDDEDATPYSDVAHFRDGLKWAYAASDWENVR
ncbi:MAG: hypothetical protein GY851_00465 [bacterium]|nr:hypothetical protein [bacterium]